MDIFLRLPTTFKLTRHHTMSYDTAVSPDYNDQIWFCNLVMLIYQLLILRTIKHVLKC